MQQDKKKGKNKGWFERKMCRKIQKSSPRANTHGLCINKNYN